MIGLGSIMGSLSVLHREWTVSFFLLDIDTIVYRLSME